MPTACNWRHNKHLRLLLGVWHSMGSPAAHSFALVESNDGPRHYRRLSSIALAGSITPTTLRQMTDSVHSQSGYDMSVDSMFRQ